jgi:hypothetical protein
VGSQALDHVVHFNNGSGAASPIVIRLLPGEETIFNLKVVNHGEPSNISLQASSPVFKAVRLRKPDHYVVMEEIIPIMARMPANKKRLDGEILLSGGGRESRVPITLLRDSEDLGDGLEDRGQQGGEELKDDLMGEALEREDANDDGDEEEDEDADLAIRRRDGWDREGSDDDDDENEDEDKEKGPRLITFSHDQDLERYRSATRQRRVAGAPESRKDRRVQERAGGRADKDLGAGEGVGNRYYGQNEDRNDFHNNNRSDGRSDDRNGYRSDSYSSDGNDRGRGNEIESHTEDDNSPFTARFSNRINRVDDRFVDKSNRQEESPRFIPRQVVTQEEEERQRSTSNYEESYQEHQGFRQELDNESQEILTSAERAERGLEDPEDYFEQDEGPLSSQRLDNLGGFSDLGALQVVPVTIFLALVIVLVLTFITESIPEFPGALGSSILIVTLIIYGAATLLKA